jgi:hypothetical protein
MLSITASFAKNLLRANCNDPGAERTTRCVKVLDELSTARENAITPVVALLLHPPDGM